MEVGNQNTNVYHQLDDGLMFIEVYDEFTNCAFGAPTPERVWYWDTVSKTVVDQEAEVVFFADVSCP